MHYFYILGLAALLSIFGCSEAEDAAQGVKQSVVDYPIMDTWAGKCTDAPIFDVASGRKYYVFSGNDFTEVLELYKDGDCQESGIRASYTGSLKVLGDAQKIPEARRIDVNRTKAYLKATSEAGKNILETINACGRDSWPIGERYEVTASVGDVNCPLEETPAEVEAVTKVEGDTLFFNSEWLSGEKRKDVPDKLDRENPFQKYDKEVQP